MEITCVGEYPPGSAGNTDAAQMRNDSKRIIASEAPAAVLFNLQELKYVWGDSICGLAHTVADPKTRSMIPACVLAKGRTAEALQPLFEKGWVFEMAGMQLFDEEESALRFLRSRLGSDAPKSLFLPDEQ